MAIVLKIFRTQKGNRYALILGNYLTCVLIAFLLLPDARLVFRGSSTTLLCSLAGGFFFVVSLVLMQSSIRANGATLTAAFSKLGLIVPLVISTAVLGERPGPLQIIGLVLVFAAILLMNFGGGKKSGGIRAAVPSLLGFTLLFGGSGDSMAKLFERVGDRSEDTLYFFYLFLAAAILTVMLAVLEQKKTGKPFLPLEFLAGIAVGIPNYFSSFLLLQALVHLPAILVYPCFSTGTLLTVALVSALFFSEHPGKQQKLGLALILAALVLLNL